MNDILVKFPARNQIHDRNSFIHELREKLKGRVKEAWLFGSVARGNYTRRSDVDLILVIETNLRFTERINLFPDLLAMGNEMDILIYTPDEFEYQEKRAMDNGFWRAIMRDRIRVV